MSQDKKNWVAEAAYKLEEEKNARKSNRYDPVADYLFQRFQDFIGQNEEFAQAMAKSGKTFSECIDVVTKDCGKVLSDLDAMCKAVAFYFEGATVAMECRITLPGDIPEEEHKAVILDLIDSWE